MSKEPNPRNNEDFYDKKWQEVTDSNTPPVDIERLDLILKAIERVLSAEAFSGPVPLIAEVGCGVGWMTPSLAAYGNVTGFDPSSSAIEIARKKNPEASFHSVDLIDQNERAPFCNLFDMTVCSEVIEHIPSDRKDQFATALAKIAKPGGYLIITTPNKHASEVYWRQSFSESWKQPVEEWLTPKELVQLLAPNFIDVDIHTFNWSFAVDGVYRWVNSRTINKIASILRLTSVFDKYRRKHFGLYTIAVFKRRDLGR